MAREEEPAALGLSHRNPRASLGQLPRAFHLGSSPGLTGWWEALVVRARNSVVYSHLSAELAGHQKYKMSSDF